MEFLSFRKNDKFVKINDFGSKLLNDSISSEFDLMSNFPKHFIFKSRHHRMVRPWIGTVQSYNHVFVLKNSLGCRLKPISDQKPHPQILFSMNVFRIQLTIWTLPIYNHWKESCLGWQSNHRWHHFRLLLFEICFFVNHLFQNLRNSRSRNVRSLIPGSLFEIMLNRNLCKFFIDEYNFSTKRK